MSRSTKAVETDCDSQYGIRRVERLLCSDFGRSAQNALQPQSANMPTIATHAK